MAIAAVGQLCSTSSMLGNLAQCKVLFQKASIAGAKALFLPEASDYIASSASESISLAQSVTTSPFVLGIQALAKKHHIAVNVGVHEPADTPAEGDLQKSATNGSTNEETKKKIKNTSLWIDETGKLIHRYQKVHLFDVAIKDGPVLKESDSVEKGMLMPQVINTVMGRTGLLICFDLRFPEISLSLKRQGAEITAYPSAFTVPTGIAHWETLLRARAIETQSYVIAAAQVGRHNEKRVSYGHSMIIDPWGKVISELGGGEDVDGRLWKESIDSNPEMVDQTWAPEIIIADIDLALGEKIRREMPLLRRTDLYPEI